jgi:hypothetical protein
MELGVQEEGGKGDAGVDRFGPFVASNDPDGERAAGKAGDLIVALDQLRIQGVMLKSKMSTPLSATLSAPYTAACQGA